MPKQEASIKRMLTSQKGWKIETEGRQTADIIAAINGYLARKFVYPISTTIRERIRDDIIFCDKTFEKIVRFPFATNPFSYEKYPVVSESRIAIVRESKTTFLSNSR